MIETYSRKKCVSPFKINSKCALVIFFIFSQNMLIWNKLSECVGEVQNLFTYNLHVYGIQHFEYTLTNLCGDISQCTKGVYSIQNFGYTSSIYGWYSIAVHKVCIACSKFWKHRLWVCMSNIQNLSLHWNHIMIMCIWFQILNTLWINMDDFQKMFTNYDNYILFKNLTGL